MTEKPSNVRLIRSHNSVAVMLYCTWIKLNTDACEYAYEYTYRLKCYNTISCVQHF